jgi:hypothetical protein
MKKRNIHTAAKSAILFTFVLVLTNSLFAQSETKKDSVSSASPSTIQTVNAQQASTWTVGIDAARNTVQVVNAAENPVPVTLVGAPSRQAFQRTISLSIFAGGPSSSTETFYAVPDGKRFVIENVSASAEIPAGESVQLMFLTNLNNTSAGNSVYHMIALSPQGTFGSSAVLMANHKTLVVGAGRIWLRARPTWLAGTGNASLVLSGYLEDLPIAP